MSESRTSFTTSTDGTRVAYHSVGNGPGLVIVHGAMQSGVSQLELAQLLSPAHTVHLLDRRGRGASGGAPASNTRQEVEDVRAVLLATGARDLLGVSSGAIIAGRAALETDLDRVVLFEPPLSVDGSVRLDLVPNFLSALDADDLPRAMALSMKLAQMGPAWMFGLPTSVLAAVSKRMLARDDARELPAGAVRVRDLVRALGADFAVVVENADRAADFSAIRARTLLIDGTKTRPYLRGAVAALDAALPHAQRVALQGQRHGVTQDRAQWGRPDLVAPVLMEFLAA